MRAEPHTRQRLPLPLWYAVDHVAPRPNTSDPSICHGQPTIRGLRYPVTNLLELLASGMTIEEVLEDHPDLERDDLLAALEYGALTSGTRVVSLNAA